MSETIATVPGIPDTTTARTHGALAMWLYLGANVPLVVAVFAFPLLHTYLWGLLGLGSAAMVVVGVHRNRPGRRRSWYFLAAALTTFACGDISYDVLTKILHENNPFPSIADAFYLVTAPLLVVGLVGMVRARRRLDGDPGVLLDSLTVTAGLAVVSWVYLIQPYVHAPHLTLFARLVSMAYPLMDILNLSVIARLLFGGGGRNVALRLLSLGAVGLLIADCVYGWIQLHGTWAVGGPTDLGWVAFYVLWGAAALHPSMREVTVVQAPRIRVLRPVTLLLLGACTLIAPVLVACRDLGGTTSGDAGVLAVASAVIFVLVMLRLTGLARGQAVQARRDLALRAFSERLVAAADRCELLTAAAKAVAEIGSGVVLGCFVVSEDDEGARVVASSDPRAPHAVGGASGKPTADVPSVMTGSAAGELVEAIGGSQWTERALRDEEGGRERMLIVHVRPLPLDLLAILDGIVASLGGALERVTMTRIAHEAQSQARFRSLIQSASDVILVVSDSGTLRTETPSATLHLGYTPEELASLHLADLLSPEDAAYAESLLASMRSSADGEAVRRQWRVRRADGRWLDMEVIANDLTSDLNIGGVVLTMRDVSERTQLEHELRHRAFHDGLTGLANRELLLDRIGHAVRQDRHVEASGALLIIDLDDFKLVNDRYGHEGGDQILVETARRLRECTRPGDTAARLGGDEFAVFVEPDDDYRTAAAVLAGRILEALREPFDVDGAQVSNRATIGIAMSTSSCHDATQMLREGDLALFAAKGAGKNTYRFFEAGLHQAVLTRLERRDELERAVALDQLRLYYQPIVRLVDGELIGLEALVRWQHPTLGLLPPDQFISVAEESGIVVPMGAWVLDRACADLRRWRAVAGSGGRADQLRMSVNLSPKQLQSPELPSVIRGTLLRHRIPSTDLTLEVTESVLLDDADASMSRLVELHDAGMTLALDDFGTGYSSLSYLHQFPIDVIKIDRSFVQRIEEEDGLTILDAIVGLARSLNLDVVAEGIESSSQARQLRLLGCEKGQGFHFGPPMPTRSIEGLLSTWDSASHCGDVSTTPPGPLSRTSPMSTTTAGSSRGRRVTPRLAPGDPPIVHHS